jgi:lipopolysaccharide transport system ATP-binding protein
VEEPRELAVSARGLGVKYDLLLSRPRTFRRTVAELGRHSLRRDGHYELWALQDVSLDLHLGEILGVVGRNASGKSTLLMAIAGIIGPDRGYVDTFGRTPTLLTIGAGFEPELTGRENIFLNAAYLGMKRVQIAKRVDEIIEYSELGALIDAPIRNYSAGMRVRLGFSITAHVEPDILLLDEVLGVGDLAFQEKSKEKLGDLVDAAKAIVVVNHHVPFLMDICTKVMWLDRGEVAAYGDAAETLDLYVREIRRQSVGPVRSVS